MLAVVIISICAAMLASPELNNKKASKVHLCSKATDNNFPHTSPFHKT